MDTMHKLVYPDDDNTMALRKARLQNAAQARRMPSDSGELLRKGLFQQLRRAPHSIGDPDVSRKREFGEISTQLGRLQIAHDPENDSLSVHGVSIPMADVDEDLRGAIYNTSAAFSRAENAEEQRGQVVILGTVIDAALRRHTFLDAAVREHLRELRYGV